MIGGIIVGVIGIAIGAFFYFNRKGELAIAKADIQFAHRELDKLHTALKQKTAGVIGAADVDAKAVLDKVRAALIKHL
jgi:hypothetical protein